MTVQNLIDGLNMKVLTNGNCNAEIEDCYLCDMLSFVMAKAKKGDAWITVQTNINVIAVASLAECACVIVPEDIPVEQPTIDRANEHGVVILSTSETAFKTAYFIGKSILN